MSDRLEPSDAERAGWPDATRAYVEALEAEIERLEDAAVAAEQVKQALIGTAARLRAAVTNLLPLAQGYAAQNPLGANDQIIESAQDALKGDGT